MHYNRKETIQALIITTKFRRCEMLVIIHAQNELESWEAGVGMKEMHGRCMKSTLSPRGVFSVLWDMWNFVIFLSCRFHHIWESLLLTYDILVIFLHIIKGEIETLHLQKCFMCCSVQLI